MIIILTHRLNLPSCAFSFIKTRHVVQNRRQLSDDNSQPIILFFPQEKQRDDITVIGILGDPGTVSRVEGIFMGKSLL